MLPQSSEYIFLPMACFSKFLGNLFSRSGKKLGNGEISFPSKFLAVTYVAGYCPGICFLMVKLFLQACLLNVLTLDDIFFSELGSKLSSFFGSSKAEEETDAENKEEKKEVGSEGKEKKEELKEKEAKEEKTDEKPKEEEEPKPKEEAKETKVQCSVLRVD